MQGLFTQTPWPAFLAVLRTVKDWSLRAPVQASRVRVFDDPEDLTWMELAIELKLDVASDEAAFSLWEEIGDMIDKSRLAFTPEDRAWFERHFAVHLYWGADPWDDG